MNIELLDSSHRSDFTAYCRAHRAEVDDSFLYDEDLEVFQPGEENPTVAAWEDGHIAGAASLILDEYMRRGNRGRFRIFHAESGSPAVYETMLRALLPHAAAVSRLYVYAHEQNAAARAILEGLAFQAERYSFLLCRQDEPVPEAGLPEGFTIAEYVPGRDAAAWCAVRNAAFATLKGSETPITEEMADQGNRGTIPGGAMLLNHGGQTIGVVKAEDVVCYCYVTELPAPVMDEDG